MNSKIGLIGKKIGMGHIYDEVGERHSVTIIHSPDCVVTAIRTQDKDGYTALQLGVGTKKDKNVSKPLMNQFKTLKHTPRSVREFRLDEETCQTFKVGDPVTVGIFEKGQYVDVRGKTVGKGFQGVMKRYGFKGSIATHGTHESFRGGGSVGARTWPGRIYKGRKMPGQMGNIVRTAENLKVMEIDPKQNVLLLKGSIPGSKNQWIEVRLAVKKDQRPKTSS